MLSDLQKKLKKVTVHPGLIQRDAIETLTQMTEKLGRGEAFDYTHPNSPFNVLLESQCVMISGFIDESYLLNRRQYPAAAQTEDDIYYHMSDKDYIGRFALPSKENFRLVFDLHEVKHKLVYDPELDIRKLVIPRDTFIEVNGVEFTMEYPIVIKELRHGGLQINYDISVHSPFHVFETSQVYWEINKQIENEQMREYLIIEVPLYQFKVRSTEQSVTLATPVEMVLPLTDYYYHIRAFYKNRSGVWVEMKTTHSPDVYNIDEPTAVLQVQENRVLVKVPQIYSRTGLIDSKFRVDLYETKGDISMNLSHYSPNDFKLTYQNLNQEEINEYSAPIQSLNFLFCYANSITNGGRNPLTFEQLKNRVKLNAYGPRDIPISNIDIETHLEDNGFVINKNVDVVTSRVYWATRSLPKPSNPRLITPASSTIDMLISSVDDINQMAYARSHHEAITILPDTIYVNNNGIISIVPKNTVERFKLMSPEDLSIEFSKNHYYFSPFHYVLDFSNNRFDLRAYYLDGPRTDIKEFVSTNDSTLLDISIDNEKYQIERSSQGYKVYIQTKSSDVVKAMNDEKLFVWMLFKPRGERKHAYLKGQLEAVDPQTKERIYSFHIQTNYHVNAEHDLILTNFKMHNNDPRNIPISLTEDVEILFATNEELGHQWKVHGLDNKLPRWMMEEGSKAITSEKIRVTFGYPLLELWKQARSITSTAEYRRYETDIEERYENDVLDTTVHPGGTSIEDGRVVFHYKHRKGDALLDALGNPLIRHRKGTPILDEDGVPIILEPRKTKCQCDIMLIEAVYLFATDEVAKQYKQEMIDMYVDWIVQGLKEVNDRVLEQTRIYFHPKTTIGQIPVIYDNGIRATINATQSFNVTLMVNKNIFTDIPMRENIRDTTIRIIAEMLDSGTISNSDILAELVDNYGDSVIGVKLEGLGGSDDITAISILDATKRCSIRKKLVVNNDNSLSIAEDVVVNFVRHDLTDVKL